MNKNTFKERNKSRNPKVCLGWTQEWTSPRTVGRNEYLNVREIVRGPFSSPKLIRTRPFVSCSSSQQFRTVSDECCPVRRGIPDAWREYLGCRGLCGIAEITIMRKNLIPSCIRSVATDRLWNEIGLPLMQGIPDPWKSKSIRHCNSSKYLRQRRYRNKHLCPRVGCVYDGDDEAEIERGAECQFNKKGLLRKKQKELNLTKRRSLSKQDKNDLIVIKDEQMYVSSSQTGESIQTRKRKGDKAEKKKDSTKVQPRHAVRRVPEKAHLHGLKTSLLKEREDLDIKKKIQTDVKKTNAAAQTNPTVKPTIEEAQNTPSKKNLGINTSNSTWPHNVCCNCLLQNYMTYLSGFSNRLKDPRNHVLCENCENASYKEQQRKVSTKTTGHFCTPDPKKYSRRATIYEWTKLKFCDCVQKARDRFVTEEPDQRNVKTTQTLVSKEEMKLLCYRCNSPYLRIQNAHAKSHRQKKCVCKRKNLRAEQEKIKESTLKNLTARERRRSISCSNKHCGMGVRSRARDHKSNVEQPLTVTYEKTVAEDKVQESKENGYKSDVQSLYENVRGKEDKERTLRGSDNLEAYVEPFYEDSNVTILYLVSDSGDDGDISEYTTNNIYTLPQVPKVTSLTYIERLRDSMSNKLPNNNPRQRKSLNDISSDPDECVCLSGSKTRKNRKKIDDCPCQGTDALMFKDLLAPRRSRLKRKTFKYKII